MQTMPELRVRRFAQLDSGDLFLWRHAERGSVGIVAADPIENGRKLILSLGPDFPDDVIGPFLRDPNGTTVVSFGKEYVLRLPVQPTGWLDTLPALDIRCILATETGVYIRANGAPRPGQYHACYVDLSTGLIVTRGSGASQQFTMPSGIPAFAVQWEIVTTEKKPRVILAYSSLHGDEKEAQAELSL